jgi:hypothetical protein
MDNPFKQKSDAIALMKIWKVEVELGTEDKIIAVRTDNAPELIQAIGEWRSGMRSEVTTIALSHQNMVAEWYIRIAKANIRAKLKEAELLLEFWDQAVEYEVYIRNCTNIEPDSNGKNRIPTIIP